MAYNPGQGRRPIGIFAALGLAIGLAMSVPAPAQALPTESSPARMVRDVFTCRETSPGPAIVGWCVEGTFWGLARFGPLNLSNNSTFALLEVGGVNIATNSFVPVQFGAFNWAEQTGTLLQVGLINEATLSNRSLLQLGLANTTKEFAGAQLGVINATRQNSSGIAVAVANDAARASVHGVHAAVLMNRARRLSGIQAALAINDTAETVAGVQAHIGAVTALIGGLGLALDHPIMDPEADIVLFVFPFAGLVNDAGVLNGAQIGAWFNRTRARMAGVQLGLVNTADTVRGLQIGLVNHARRIKGLQIGLVNCISEGTLPFMIGLNGGWQ